MKPMSREEITDLRTYKTRRPSLRKQARKAMELRTLTLGPLLNVTFLSREEILYNCHEYIRSLRIREEPDILEVLRDYNAFLPSHGELASRLILRPGNRSDISKTLHSFAGLAGSNAISLLQPRGRVKTGICEPADGLAETPHILYVLRFDFTDNTARQMLEEDTTLKLVIDYRTYQEAAVIGEDQKAALLSDLQT